MVVILGHVTLEEDVTKEGVAKTTEGIEQDIKELLRCALRMVVTYGF